MANKIVTTPYQHDVQAGGTPMVPSSSNANLGVVPVSNADGTPIGGGEPDTVLLVGQGKIAVTATAIQLGSNGLSQGITIKALSTNAHPLTIGISSVTNAYDGTGAGDALEAGDRNYYPVNNTNLIYINGTAGDVFTWTAA